jgi:hypothetical protein
LSKDQPLTFVGETEINLPSIHLYPNPAVHEIQLDGVIIGDEYAITNLAGILMNTGSYNGSIDVTNLSTGVYLLQINGQTLEFIK